jgi:hypothetical protein
MIRITRAAKNSKTVAAAMAGATRGRARVFKGRACRGPSVDEGLEEWFELKRPVLERPAYHGECREGDA